MDQNQINSIMEQDMLISNIGMGIIGSAVLATGAYTYGTAIYGAAMTLAAQNPQVVKESTELANQVFFKGNGKAPSSSVPSSLTGLFSFGIDLKQALEKEYRK